MACIPTAVAQDLSWQGDAAERLRAIYDRREFRAEKIEPQWLSDSSGYKLRETDPETNKPVVALYDVGAGARSVGEKT